MDEFDDFCGDVFVGVVGDWESVVVVGVEGDGEVDGDIIVRPAVTEASASIDPGYPDRQVTAEDVETVYNYVLSAKKQLVYDTSLFDIIDEETSAYFAGTKSLDEILPLMESRINIFLAEGR